MVPLLAVAVIAAPLYAIDEGRLDDTFRQVAREHEVPAPLLEAIGWEATRWTQDVDTVWGGHGMMDLLEEGTGPSLQRAARLLQVPPEQVASDPLWNIRGAAVLLADFAKGADGDLPDPQDLLAWWEPVQGFSRSPLPELRQMYAATLFDAIERGVGADTAWGPMHIESQPVGHHGLRPVLPPANTDYAGAAQFVAACSDNYSNYSRTASDISYVIIHTVQGSYDGCISWFQNCTAAVSAHYVVRSSDGQVTQMVLEEDVAWHAGNWDYNLVSVGIEHEGYVEYPDKWYTDAMYEGSAALTADICDRNGIPVDRNHIIGHNEVPGATHTDPGSGWDWDYYMDLVENGAGGSTGTLVGVVAHEDIYSGNYITGASVWLESTGESTTSDADGYYYFYDLEPGEYTAHAIADGYQENTCTRSVEGSGDWWCSIALYPEDDPPEDTGDPGGGEDTGTVDQPDDTGGGGGDSDPGTDPAPPPGDLVAMDETSGGCGCGTPGPLPPVLALLLGLAAPLVRRRSR